MAQVRPSLVLIMDIDESLATQKTREEVGRCYNHVGTALIRTHQTPRDAPVSNTMRMLVKLGTRRYLYSADEGADELWESVMEKWLYNEFYNVANSVKIYNRRQREIENVEIDFDWLKVELQNGDLSVSLYLDSNSDLPASCAKLLTQLRNALNADTLGKNVASVMMPSAQAYDVQKTAGLSAKKAREEQARREAEAAADRAAAQAAQAEAAAEENFLESPELLPESDVVAEAKAYRDELMGKYTFDDPDFAIDYRIWTITYSDGNTRQYDSERGLFL